MRRVNESEVLEHLQYVNIGMASVIRYKNERKGLGVLNQSVSEHVIGMLHIADVVRGNLDELHEINWAKVDKMIRYHDVGEIETGDIIVPLKVGSDSEHEMEVVEDILKGFPRKLGQEVLELLHEKERCETVEARITHAIDKIEAQVLIATERGVQEIKDLHQRIGIDLATTAMQRMLSLKNLLIEWEFDILVELLDEVWEKQIELGILDEDPELKREMEEEVEEPDEDRQLEFNFFKKIDEQLSFEFEEQKEKAGEK